MSSITSIHAREILDSRGFPTVEAQIELASGSKGIAAVPSGASTGAHEACELRDEDNNRYKGKGVLKAVGNVNVEIAKAIVGKEFGSQLELDKKLIELDGTQNKTRLGANAILATSLAYAYAIASQENMSLFRTIADGRSFNNPVTMPVPMMNILNGGQHATNNIDFQEFMIVPVGAHSFSEALMWSSQVYQTLKSMLASRNLSTGLGDEGGFAPNINTPEDVLSLLTEAIEATGLKAGTDISFALDVASTEFYSENMYQLFDGTTLDSQQMVEHLAQLCEAFPIISIEDGLAEDDWQGWAQLTERLGDKVQLVGDDLFVTNTNRLQQGIEAKTANAILIKLNQIGTISETLDVMELARNNNYASIVSHRSGETHDTTIADLSVATNCGQIKTGAPARTDRVAKYNQLLRIEEELGENAVYPGKGAYSLVS